MGSVPNCWLIRVAVLLSPIAIGHPRNLCMVESGEEQCGQVLAKNLTTAQSVRILQRTSKILRWARREVRIGRFSDRLTTLTSAQIGERSVSLAAGDPGRRESITILGLRADGREEVDRREAKIPRPERRETARIDDQKECRYSRESVGSHMAILQRATLETSNPPALELAWMESLEVHSQLWLPQTNKEIFRSIFLARSSGMSCT